MTDTDERLDEAKDLARQVGNLLYGHGPDVQSAVLADLVAAWLAGLHQPDDEAATAAIRATFLGAFVVLVRDLTPPTAKLLGTPAPAMPTQPVQQIAAEWTPVLEDARLKLCVRMVNEADRRPNTVAANAMLEAEMALTLLADIVTRIQSA